MPKDRVFLRHDPNASWLYPGFPQDDSHPVVCVNWHDANAYTAWLAQTAGKPYRLLSEAEREYVARAGTGTPFWWGASITPAQANYNPTGEAYESAGAKSDWRRATVPVGSFQANPWGLYQVHGNVTEWCEDVAHFNYYGAPTDGSAWLQGGDPSQRMARGGSWDADPMLLSCATRYDCPSDRRSVSMGFRVARAVIQ